MYVEVTVVLPTQQMFSKCYFFLISVSAHVRTSDIVSPYQSSFKLKYSGFTMLCQFLLCSKVNQPHIHVYSLFGFPSHSDHRSALSRVPCAIQISLVIDFIHSSVQTPVLISHKSPFLYLDVGLHNVSEHCLKRDKGLWHSIRRSLPVTWFLWTVVFQTSDPAWFLHFLSLSLSPGICLLSCLS